METCFSATFVFCAEGCAEVLQSQVDVVFDGACRDAQSFADFLFREIENVLTVLEFISGKTYIVNH